MKTGIGIKRYLSLCLSLFMVANLINIQAIAAVSTAEIIVEENFDSGEISSDVLPNFTIENMPDGKDGKCVNLKNGANQVITLPQTITDGIIVFDFNMYPTSTWDSEKSFILYANNAKVNLMALIKSGWIRNSAWTNKKQIELDKWHNFRIIIDVNTGKYYIHHNGEFLDGIIEDAFVSQIQQGIEKFLIFSPPTIYMDDIKIYTDSSLNTFDTYPSNGAEDVNKDIDIKVNFNTIMDKSTLTEGNVQLINVKKDESVDIEIKDVKAGSIIIKPKKSLDYYTKYKIELSDNVVTENSENLLCNSSYFRTKQREINDFITVTESSYEDNKSSIMLKNNSDNEQKVAVITALYQNNDDKPQKMIDYYVEEKVVGGHSEESFCSKEFTTETETDYTATVFIWDGIDSKNILAPLICFGNENNVTVADGTTTEGISFIKKDIDINSGIVDIDAASDKGANMRVAYTVEDPNGKVCFIGQSTTEGENGIFGIDFKFGTGVVNGTYLIKVRITDDADITSDTFEVDTTLSVPSADNVEIKGEPIVGNVVNGEYTFFHIGNIEEKGSTYKWYVLDDENGTPKEINGENEQELELTDELSGKYVVFEVTPQTYSAEGDAVKSKPVAVLTPPTVKNVKIRGKVRVGETVTAEYNYYHISSAAEKDTVIKWLYSDSDNGSWEEIGTNSSLLIKEKYANGYIKLEITPMSEEYPYKGDVVSSEVYKVAKQQTGYISGGGSGSIGSSAISGNSGVIGSTTVVLPSPSEIQSPNLDAMFTDISGHWSQEAVEKLAKEKIINGYGDGSFKPSANISRAEFVTLINNMSEISKGDNEIKFADVNEKDWFFDAVNIMSSNGIVSGDGINFRPQDNITREEIAVIIMNTYNYKNGAEVKNGSNAFNDADKISDWALESVNKTVALGIITGDENANFRPYDFATRAEAAVVISRFMNLFQSDTDNITDSGNNADDNAEYVVGDKAEILKSLGILKDVSKSKAVIGDLAEVMDNIYVHYDTNRKEDEPLIWDEALKQCLIALNYGKVLEYSGDSFEKLVSIAKSENMIENLSCEKGSVISMNDFSELICNMLHCLPVKQSYDNNKISLEKTSETLLQQKLNIIIQKGIVTGVSTSKLYSSVGLTEGFIEVSNVKYRYNDENADNLLGYPVQIYLNSDDDEILYLECLNDEYETLTINWKDIEDVSDLKITYKVDKKTKTKAFADDAAVLKNNTFIAFADSVEESVLMPERGEIVLVDNDKDGKYEVIKVTDYNVFIVDSVNATNETILLKNDAGYLKFKDDVNYNEIYYSIVRNGEECDISDLQEWDVLIVKSTKNKSDEEFYEIQVVRRSVSGVLTAYDDENIWIDGVEYETAPTLDISKLKLNVSYKFMYGGNDEIAAVCNDAPMKYGYLIKTLYSHDDEIGYANICTANNDKVKIEFAEKVKVNGTTLKNHTDICNAFTTHQLIAYNTDGYGKINEINKAIDNSANDEVSDEFSLDAEKQYRRYYKEQFQAYYKMASDGVAFFVATVADGEKFTENHVKVGTTSAYQSSNGVDCEFYDVDELGNVKAAIFFDFSSGEIPSKTVPVIVVDKIVAKLDENGDDGYAMYFYEDGKYKSLFLADEVDKANAIELPYENHDNIDSVLDLKTGDIIEYATDVNGKISVYRPVFLRTQNNTLGAYSQTETGVQPLYDAAYNIVDYAKSGDFVMKYGTDKRRYSSVSSTSVLKYDSSKNELSVATKDDIQGKNSVGDDASNVFALRMWTQLKLVVIYE